MAEGRKLVLDEKAQSRTPGQPAFLSRPPGAPVYHGFPLVEETLTDGWCYGAITDYIESDSGDGYVQAPDGSRAGLMWSIGAFAIREVCVPDDQRWGVYEIAFPKLVRNVQDLVDSFRGILPELQAIHAKVRAG